MVYKTCNKCKANLMEFTDKNFVTLKNDEEVCKKCFSDLRKTIKELSTKDFQIDFALDYADWGNEELIERIHKLEKGFEVLHRYAKEHGMPADALLDINNKFYAL